MRATARLLANAEAIGIASSARARLALVALLAVGAACAAKKDPAVEPSVCSTASTCQMRVFCDPIQNCRCLKSAEGDVRCGTPPSCSIKMCTKSSDCADLGVGYFCDSPGSGCCGDDKQRCIPPCRSTPCPPERICAGKCCLEGEQCVANACTSGGAQGPGTPVDGTWTGAVGGPKSIPVGIRFQLTEQNGRLTGRTWVEDPKTKQFLVDAALTGSRTGSSATWTTTTGMIIRGTFRADGFDGTLEYPVTEDIGRLVSKLTLRR